MEGYNEGYLDVGTRYHKVCEEDWGLRTIDDDLWAEMTGP